MTYPDTKSLDATLGYLNFSDGTPSARFQTGVNDFYRYACEQGVSDPWDRWQQTLLDHAASVEGTSAAFQDLSQARALLPLVLDHVVPAYRHHHRDLLFHLSDAELVQPFFLARVVEATLSQKGPWDETERVVAGTLGQLNDYVGHRPLAHLEGGRSHEPYAHERVRPIPIFIREAGISVGHHEELIGLTLKILSETDEAILREASFDLELLDELAVDPRSYDYGHPVTQRPGYQFGEWDPHFIDISGRFRRFVLRPVILEALRLWIGSVPAKDQKDRLYSAAAALAGTILLASGISGSGPDTHSGEVTLATLVPQVARCRDHFYGKLLESLRGPHGQRVRETAVRTRQPFGDVRQYLNHHLAGHRAMQLEDDHLAQLYARMGYADASREQASRIPTASIRMCCEIQNLMTTGHRQSEHGALTEGEATIREIEELLHRAIDCGAMVDPWNILAFQGNYSLFPAPENSIVDPRVERLLEIVHQVFELYGHLLREAAARGESALRDRLIAGLEAFASWWDKYATIEVSDIRRVSGEEQRQSALLVANLLTDWRSADTPESKLSFWRRHVEGSPSPQACHALIDALLRMKDPIASMALLMYWLSNKEQIPLKDNQASFHQLALRWVSLATTGDRTEEEKRRLIIKFVDYLEANAEDYWEVPTPETYGLGPTPTEAPATETTADEEDDLFAAAYEGVTYQDSAEDGQEGDILDGDSSSDEELVQAARQIGQHLRFLRTLAEIWQRLADRASEEQDDAWNSAVASWINRSKTNRDGLEGLMRGLKALPIAAPSGSQDSMVEFDRRRSIRDELLNRTVTTSIETAHAVRTLYGIASEAPERDRIWKWDDANVPLERALLAGDAGEVRRLLPLLAEHLKSVPLLYVPLEQGGDPVKLFRTRYTRDFLRRLAGRMSRLGLYRETFDLMVAALTTEQTQAAEPHQITEFNLLFEDGLRGVIEHLVDSMAQWTPKVADDQETVDTVVEMVHRFSRIWNDHIAGLRLSELERRVSPQGWSATVSFIRRYGRELFTQEFMSFANLRGILRHGVGAFIEAIAKDDGEFGPSQLREDLDDRLPRKQAEVHLDLVLRAVLENYDIYKEYNSITTQSDYGENVHMLLDMLRVHADYERQRWRLQPATLAHGILAQKQCSGAAALFENNIADRMSSIANQFIDRLAELERRFSMRIPAIADRVGERFVQPLKLDRILGLVHPLAESRSSGSPEESAELLAEFRSLVEHYREGKTSAGLDVPPWILRLEDEVDRVQWASEEEHQEHAVPFQPVTREEFAEQLKSWSKSAS
ncbi:hypothetical protein Pan216_06950 [Planctomycetes bacterium Pan216]|uniref:Uncharacterized protein n=1 Tax=Kolteria novifilia TaxID=2527975 RepID=A0A518AYR7_9BACT|nr:hypothetical protein Pan216_06950 [Planctomycetes bacterium Pan216]